MANKYCNLQGSQKISESYININTGFDAVEADINAVEADINALDSRVNTIITTPIDGEAAAQEIVDARGEFETLGARLTNTEDELASHKAENATKGINVLYPPSPLVAAVGDGVTDDTVAIQACINYVVSQGGGVLFFPTGTYIISQLVISDSIKLLGQNRTAILKQKDNSNDNFINITGTGKHIEIEGLVFDGNNINQSAESTQNIIKCDATGGVTEPFLLSVRNNKFLNPCYSAIFFIGQTQGLKKEYLYIEGNEFYGGNDGSINYDPRYISVANAAKAWINQNTFDFGTTPSGTGRAGITIQTGDKTQEYFSRFIVSHNEFRNIGRFASNSLGCVDMYMYGEQCIISDNVFYDSYSGCINAKTDSKNIIITKNQIYNTKNAQTSIAVNTETSGNVYHNFIISQNLIDNVTGYGISFNSSSGVVKNVSIIGNIVKQTGNHGIQLRGVENVIVADNIIENITGTSLVVYKITGAANVSNNVIKDATSYGIYMSDNFTNANLNIIGNNIRNVVRYGIYVKDNTVSNIKSANISNNRIDGVSVSTNSTGIVAENMDYLTLTGNIVTNVTNELYTAGVTTKTVNVGNSWNP